MRQPLPIDDTKGEILKVLKEGSRLILHAPTGSGKSTQAPQFILDSGLCKGLILVLEPRRIAARMLAHRVAEERGEEVGESVGFQTRYESAFSKRTRILYITEGILPRRLLSDPTLREVSAVFFDEFHERSLTTDLGLALIKSLQTSSRPDLRMVVMSATLDRESLERYLPASKVVASDGRTHPVDIRYLTVPRENPPWESALAGVRLLLKEASAGDILVFQPGAYEIRKTVELLKNSRLSEPLQVFPLYGDLPWEQQQAALQKGAHRKVIVATNIAETSLTLPGVRHVVDAGHARINRYDAGRGFNLLFTESISQASADQRAGRAGREAPGVCVRLWSSASHHERPRQSEPEVSRVDLSEAALFLHSVGVCEPQSFDWFEPPSSSALAHAESLLHELGAVTADGKLTAEGRALSAMPAHPRLSKLLYEAARRGVAAEGALAVALLSERPIRSGKADLHDRNDLTTAHSDFQFLETLLERAAEADFAMNSCIRLGINGSAARQVLRTQEYYLKLLRKQQPETGVVPSDANEALSKAVALAYPDRLARFRDNGTLQYVLRGGRSGELVPDSAARGSKLIVAAEIRETRFRGQATTRTGLSLACGIEEEWLLELFPDHWTSEQQLQWNGDNKSVEEMAVTRCLGVAVEEQRRAPTDAAAASHLLWSTIIDKSLRWEGWTEETEAWVDKVRWLKELFPEQELPHFGENAKQDILLELCAGETRYGAVKEKDALAYLRGRYADQLSFIESMAPSFVPLKNGKRMPIRYESGKSPIGRAKIQELYGMEDTPKVAAGRAGLVIEILAPNQRPVQVTNDLRSFWLSHYPELKKALSRRYPRHEWR